jgi:hypothetical protein
MSSLYKLTEEYEILKIMLYDEETDEQMILDTLEGKEGEIEEKADSYAKIINELLGDAKKIKEEKQRLDERQKMFENRANYLKQNLYLAMKKINKPKFNTDLFSFNIQKNGGKQALTIDGDVPEEYKKIIKENDNEKIRADLEAGKELPFAHLEPRGESLRIK